MNDFSIGDIVDRTGIAEGTLRMWERRHGFPRPERLASGHRRYSEADLEAVRRVVAQRAAGVTLPIAIARASTPAPPAPSLFAWLRRAHPELDAQKLSRPVMISLSEAIEHECLARAEHPLFFGCFQRERFYRRQEARWRELCRGAELACVFADFERPRAPSDGPLEVPIAAGSPLMREWAIVCDAPGCGVCLSGLETLPGPQGAAVVAGARCFEALWSVDPEIVRGAANVFAAIASIEQPELVDAVQERLQAPTRPPGVEHVRLAAAITNRALAGVSERQASNG